jgi:hypothetical protein
MTQPGASEPLRRWPRHRIDVRLRIAFNEAGREKSAFGRGNNLSHGGMGAYIPCAIPVGASVFLDVSFPYSPVEVSVKAVVRSCEGFRYGLEFEDLADNVRALIEKNCAAAAAKH